MYAKKSLGQNFLINDKIISDIVNLIDCKKNDLVIEIGPGMGALSSKLKGKCLNYLAIEIDPDMKECLDRLQINVVYEDILKTDLKKLLGNYNYDNLYIIGNLPYYITGPILEKMILSDVSIYKMIFMVQKEVAQRYSASPLNKEFGYMSLFVQYYYNVIKAFDVNKVNFKPVPKVDSSIIVLNKKSDYEDIDFNKYTSFLKQAFSMKRKTLKNNLREHNWEKVKKVLFENNLNENVRAENISQEVFIKIFKAIN